MCDVAPDHDGQGSCLGARNAARHRGVQPGGTVDFQKPCRQLACDVGWNAGVVHQPLQALRLGNALWAEDHRFDRLGIHQANQYTVNALSSLHRAVTQLRALRHQSCRLFGGAVPHLHGMTGYQQAMDHGCAHQSQATKSKFHFAPKRWSTTAVRHRT